MAKKPVYTVGRVARTDDGKITAISIEDFEVEAATQEKACDIVAERQLSAGSAKTEYGAFLASSLKTFDYEPEPTVNMKKSQRHGAANGAAPEAAPARKRGSRAAAKS